MGNSPSKASSADSSSSSSLKSQSLAGDNDQTSGTRRRLSSTANNVTSPLAVPGSSSHRRRRSANVVVDGAPLAPPPPYWAAINTPSSVPPTNITAPAVTRTGSSSHRAMAGTSSSRTAEYLQAPMRRESVENALETLRKYDTVIIVDDSSSMKGKRWQEARDALSSLADVTGTYDTDGIDVHFLNHKAFASNVRDASTVSRLFERIQPRGITPIGGKLEELLLSYLDKIENAKAREIAGESNALKTIKPVNYIVLTDGAPTDDPEDVIVMAARRLDRGNFPITQVGIQFVQIGNSPHASEFLQELDDGLASDHGVRDIVDTTPFTLTGGVLTAEMLTKILLGGINRRVDRRGGGSVMH